MPRFVNAVGGRYTAAMARWFKFSKTLPQKTGVYLFHGDDDSVIYVGKAIKLRARVSSYFRPKATLDPAKTIMVHQIQRIEYILVRSETEALLLESTLIKKHRPKYNIILKDDKYFQYIKINLGQDFPPVSTVRRIVLDGGRYFGPYTSGLAVRRTLRLLKRLFPFKTCNNPPDRPCFDHHLGRCLGHNVGPDSQRRYQRVIHDLISFLEGHTGNIIKKLKVAMVSASAHRDFETAALLRDRLAALEHILEQQTVVSVRRDSFDVLAMARLDSLAAVNLFQIRWGKLVQRDQFMLQHTADQSDQEIFSAFIGQYYSQSTSHPRDLYLPVDVPSDVTNSLQLRAHRAQRGLKKKLVLMGQENAAEHLKREKDSWLSAEAKTRLGLQELATALNLEGPPKRIEMYDISNWQGQHAVGSMVVFEDGRPKKSEYRKFAIRDTNIPDDMRRLAEVIRRRFSHHRDVDEEAAPLLLKEGRGGGKEKSDWPIPDLLILDGGKPQLSVVIKNVPGLAQHVPVVALAKEREEIFVPGRPTPIRLAEGSQELFLIQRIRDEAHRFAIGFYRKKHGRETTKSVLDEIPGLGPKLKRALLDRFGSVAGIRAAPDGDVVAVVGSKQADVVRQYI